jgi:S-adenosylmethionine:tRNA ribosyltransferase-isomerase
MPDDSTVMIDEADFLLENYSFDLPREQIAQVPPKERGSSRLLIMPRKGRLALKHKNFEDFPDCLPKNTLLVANNARVLPARLTGRRHTGGKVEFLLLTPLPLLMEQARKAASGGDNSLCAEARGFLRAGGKIHAGQALHFGAGIVVTPLKSLSFGMWQVLLAWQGEPAEAFAAAGHIPLPPYIKRPVDNNDSERYQTVFADGRKTGAVAAPTAGLHFTPAMLQRLASEHEWAEITLYVGYGTFSPVRSREIREHHIHREYLEIPENTAKAVRRAKTEGRPVLAVGTTSARALEGVAALYGDVRPYSGLTDIFFYPGKEFRVIDSLLTNFHLPQSSLLMLVAALAGRKRVLEAYREAVKNGYRFFSYGDAMLIC